MTRLTVNSTLLITTFKPACEYQKKLCNTDLKNTTIQERRQHKYYNYRVGKYL